MVLSSEENSYFSSGPLHRSHSQPKFVGSNSTYLISPTPSRSKINPTYTTLVPDINIDQQSNTTSPRVFNAQPPSFAVSAPSLSLDLCLSDEDDEDQILFPTYDDVGYYGQVEDLEPPTSPRTGDSYTVSPTSNNTSTNVSRPDSPLHCEHAEDDTAVRTQPTRHVDYLSHNWKEEDIWSSWKHIVSKRKAYGNSARLENASWRTWIKAKYKLKTVSPETLNW